jgi:arabinogalactan endo-1,4-beta-galactosidase
MKWLAKISIVTAVTTALSGAPVIFAAGAHAATTRYEAESAPAVCDGAMASNHAGFSGSGFCDSTNTVGSAVQFAVNTSVAGATTLTLRYANGTTANRSADISVNGATVQAAFGFEGTGAWTAWASKTLPVQLNAGTNTVRLAATTAGGLGNIDYLDVTTDGGGGSSIMQGADVSTLQRAADLGAQYYYPNGTPGDPLDILKSAGVNYVRLRIWNNPRSGYNNKDKVLQYARTVKAKGLKLMVDFHYSDTWADPGKQYKPAAWAGHGISQLQTDVYNYTYDVCTSLKAQGTTPDSVQIGNEINTGMMWPDGQVVNNDFTNLSLLLKAGYNATKACNPGTQVIIHTALAESMSSARWFYDGIRAKGVPWDITALSYYCMWHGTLSNLSSVISDMRSRYAKPVVIAETAYPFTSANADSTPNVVTSGCSGYDLTWQGQAAEFAAVQSTARNAGAVGVFYWEPAWYAVPGNGWNPADINNSGNEWDNMAVFNWTGQLNPNIRWLP